MYFGKKLYSERKKRNLSAEQLAAECGISRSYVTLMENGVRLPSKKIIPQIARALNLNTNEIVNWYLEGVREKMQ